MNLLDLAVKIVVDDQASEKVDGLSSSIKTKISNAATSAKSALSTVTKTAAGLATGIVALSESTEEYRDQQNRLNTAFDAAGYSAGDALLVYQDFYRILGDSDTATEASQLLAKLSDSQEDLSTWTDICAGVWGTFGTSLPIESLVESANETSKTGVVVGTLADALNWAGISEDAFNESLAACSSESERNQLIMDTLNGTYAEATESFYANNQALIEQRDAQMHLQNAMATFGEIITPLAATIMQFAADLATTMQPTLETIVNKVMEFKPVLETILNFINEHIETIISFATAIGVATAAINTARTAMSILNVVMSANPILAVITVVMSLAAAMVYFFTQTDKGREIWSSFTGWLEGVWGNISGFFESTWSNIKGFFSDAATNVKETWQSVGDFFGSIPGRIQGFFSGAGSWLSNAGKNILDGLLGGLKRAWSNVTSFIGGIGSWIVSHKGPPEYDKVMLKGNGALIMNGLLDGMEDGWTDVQDFVKSKTDELGGSFEVSATGSAKSSGSKASGGVIINIGSFTHSGSEADDEKLLRRIASKVKMQQRALGVA